MTFALFEIPRTWEQMPSIYLTWWWCSITKVSLIIIKWKLMRMAMMLMIVMMHSFTMMMTLIRPRHSPLHPDRFEALENTHSHSGASHAPVFQCVRISFNVCICISLNISICIFITTIICALHTYSHAPAFQCICLNACFSISVWFVFVFRSGASYAHVFQCVCISFDICICISVQICICEEKKQSDNVRTMCNLCMS